jgi:1,5-anhydro-D-fructose reductase (1,5-anhydro-D-mannitol-forming)
MSSTSLRWALLGASDIAATRMIPAFRAAGHEVVVVQSGSSEWAAEYARTHGIGAWDTSVDEAVARADVDAVYVSSTNDRHRAQVEASAAAGRHVLAEKPLALSLADAEAMVAACESAGVVMATNHHLPASPVHRTVKRLVAEGEVGEVRAIHVSHAVGLPDHLRSWRIDDPVGGGVVLDVFVHDMAAVAAVIGGRALRVSSMSRTASQVPDSVMSVVEWEGEVIIETHDAYDNFHLPTYFEVLGTTGAIRATGCMTGDPVGDVLLYRGLEATPVDVGPRDDLYLTTTEAFARAVAGDGAPIVTGHDGVRSLAAALAALESLATGCGQDVAPA